MVSGETAPTPTPASTRAVAAAGVVLLEHALTEPLHPLVRRLYGVMLSHYRFWADQDDGHAEDAGAP